jgi:hypothetical protein
MKLLKVLGEYSMNHDDIWEKSIQLAKERREHMSKCMESYDSNTHYPALKQLQEECGNLGHKLVFRYFTVLHHEYYSCDYCGFGEIA